jgi:hypothetical protein
MAKPACRASPTASPRVSRATLLAKLAPQMGNLPLEKIYPLWRETLTILARRTRKDLLTDVGALSPVLAVLGGGEAIHETMLAIEDVGR